MDLGRCRSRKGDTFSREVFGDMTYGAFNSSRKYVLANRLAAWRLEPGGVSCRVAIYAASSGGLCLAWAVMVACITSSISNHRHISAAFGVLVALYSSYYVFGAVSGAIRVAHGGWMASLPIALSVRKIAFWHDIGRCVVRHLVLCVTISLITIVQLDICGPHAVLMQWLGLASIGSLAGFLARVLLVRTWVKKNGLVKRPGRLCYWAALDVMRPSKNGVGSALPQDLTGHILSDSNYRIEFAVDLPSVVPRSIAWLSLWQWRMEGVGATMKMNGFYGTVALLAAWVISNTYNSSVPFLVSGAFCAHAVFITMCRTDFLCSPVLRASAAEFVAVLWSSLRLPMAVSCACYGLLFLFTALIGDYLPFVGVSILVSVILLNLIFGLCAASAPSSRLSIHFMFFLSLVTIGAGVQTMGIFGLAAIPAVLFGLASRARGRFAGA
jgi:hypothetical protein